MYIPSKIDLLKLFLKYPEYHTSMLIRKFRFFRRYRWVDKDHDNDDNVPPPLAFKLYLTLNCNLRCGMCMLWGDKGVNKDQCREDVKEELSWDVVKRLFEEMGDNRPSFILSGGEPLLYSHFNELAGLLKKHKCFAYLCTNGIFLDKHIEAIKDNPYLIHYISLDGTEEVNDKIRGEGVYKKVIENIKLLKSLKKKPYVGVQFTLQHGNEHVMYETFKEVKDLGVDWILINLQWYISPEKSDEYEKVMKNLYNIDPKSHLGFVLPYNVDKEEFIKQCKKIQGEKWPFQISCYLKKPEDIISYVDTPDIHPYNKICYKQWVRMDIMPNSDVTPCIQYPDIRFSNLKDKSIMEVWNSKEFTDFRKFIRKNQFPICSKCYALFLYDGKRGIL